MEIVFKQNSVEYVIDALDLGTDSDGYVTTDDGRYVPSVTGEDKVHKDDVKVFLYDTDYPGDCVLRT